MSEAASTSTPGGANAPVAVGKGASSESATRGMLEIAAAAFVVIAGILVGYVTNLEKTFISQVNSKITEVNSKIDKLSSDTEVSIEKLSSETKVSIEKLSSETKLSIVELRYDLDKKIDKLDTQVGRLVDAVEKIKN